MGIWGAEAFANDDALDWLSALDPAEGSASLDRHLRAVVDGSDSYLDARTAAIALAAAELVAALRGKVHPALPDAARTWVAAQVVGAADGDAPDTDRLALATRALDYVVTSSALSELWSQRADEPEWRSELDGLRLRLSL